MGPLKPIEMERVIELSSAIVPWKTCGAAPGLVSSSSSALLSLDPEPCPTRTTGCPAASTATTWTNVPGRYSQGVRLPLMKLKESTLSGVPARPPGAGLGSAGLAVPNHTADPATAMSG